jgi:hypothetical protein
VTLINNSHKMTHDFAVLAMRNSSADVEKMYRNRAERGAWAVPAALIEITAE